MAGKPNKFLRHATDELGEEVDAVPDALDKLFARYKNPTRIARYMQLAPNAVRYQAERYGWRLTRNGVWKRGGS